MPLIQIIPYVADQFDPGLFVFDGGTFQSGEAFVDNTNTRAYVSFEEETFNISDVFKSNYEHIGIHVFDKVQLRKNAVFKSVSLFYFTGAQVTFGFTHKALVPTVAEEPVVEFLFANKNIDNNLYTKIVKDQIQNKLTKAQNVPYILDPKTQFDPEELADTGHESSESLSRIGYSELAFDSVYITTDYSTSFMKMIKLAPEVKGVTASTARPMIAMQSSEVSSIDTQDQYTIVELSTRNNESQSNSLEFTM